MKTLMKPQDIQGWRRDLPPGARVGFVPTMGALHAGHAALLKQARAESDFVVLSIFVNPTQFDNPEDLEKYPRDLEADSRLASDCGVDVVWTPNFELMYPDNYRFKISESELSQRFCGAFRPGHFDGVLAVVMKLLNCVNATRAYFGEKDFQQLSLIRQMTEAFFMPTQIVAVPTLREADGLAMSSRNLRLSPEERKRAAEIYRALTESNSAEQARAALAQKDFRVEYLEDWQGRRLVAAWLGNVRLIDNVELK